MRADKRMTDDPMEIDAMRIPFLLASTLVVSLAACGPSAEPGEAPIVVITDSAEEGDRGTTADDEPVESPQPDENSEAPTTDPEEPDEEPVEVELEPRTETISWWEEGLTCAGACGARGWECGVDAERTGTVTYTKTTENNSGDRFTTRQTMVVETCDQEIPEYFTEYEYFTPDHEFETARCPCLAPPTTKVQVDVANLVTCAQACSDEGLACNPETPWTLGQESGGEAVYVTSDGTRYHPVGCEEIPSIEISRGGRTYTLSELHCGCL